MLRRAILFVPLVMFGLASGCNRDDDTTPIVVQPSPQSPAFPSPSVTAKPLAPRNTLIRPTNPSERLRSIQSGRNNPFAPLVATVTPGGAPAGPGANTPGGSTPEARAATTRDAAAAESSTRIARSYERFLDRVGGQIATANRPGTTSSSGSNTIAANGTPGSSGSTGVGSLGDLSLPSLPEPNLARGTQVTGVVLVGGLPRAIVKAPDESVSRTVAPGDSLSNGQVLVKAIDFSNRGEPIVVLQQLGTDVAIGVGKQPITLASATPALSPLSPVPALWFTQRSR